MAKGNIISNATLEAPDRVPDLPDDQIVAKRLDALIPPTMSGKRKFAVSMVLTGLTVGLILLAINGLILANQVYSFSGDVRFDEANGLVGAELELHTKGLRDVRLTDVKLESSAVEVVRYDIEKVRGVWEEERTPMALPVTIAVQPEFFDLEARNDVDRIRVVVWFRVTDCRNIDEAWGGVTGTLDFGEGSFPPFSSAQRLDQNRGGLRWQSDELGIQTDGSISDPVTLACELRER